MVTLIQYSVCGREGGCMHWYTFSQKQDIFEESSQRYKQRYML